MECPKCGSENRDGVMAIFGAPLAHEDHAQRACYASLFIQRGLRDCEEQIRREFSTEFKMRIGLNSGPVVVRSIGDDLRVDYTAVGDTTRRLVRLWRIDAACPAMALAPVLCTSIKQTATEDGKAEDC